MGKDAGSLDIHPVVVERKEKPGWRMDKGARWGLKLTVDSGAVTSVIPQILFQVHRIVKRIRVAQVFIIVSQMGVEFRIGGR